MKSVLKCFDKNALREYLEICNTVSPIDVDNLFEITVEAITYYRGDKKTRGTLEYSAVMEQKWYDSLSRGEPDYSVYDDEHYVCDLWAGWVIYSRQYLLSLTKDDNRRADQLSPIKSICDLGCGFGYTTAALKEIFPDATVFGTNLPGTAQYDIATLIGSRREFNVHPDAYWAGHIDLIFASEYFEHIQEPVEHLMEVLIKCTPNALIIANSFGARSAGHFNEYKHGNRFVSNKSIGRLFNSALRLHGYEMTKTGLWNNRPAYWIKK